VADKQTSNLNEDQILAFLKDAVDKIRTEEDPLELNLYRRLFRKAVPLTLRAYFTAYLLKEINNGKMPARFGSPARSDRSGRQDRQGRQGRGEGRAESRGEAKGGRESGRENARGTGERLEDSRRGKSGESRRSERTERTERPEGRQAEAKSEPRNILPDDVATTLFVSIGRNRRVYPRDLIGLIMQNVEIEREHIGDIRVLDNYSFVQIVNEDAEKVIAALNEFEYRGRKLAVSFSRKRDADVPTDSAQEQSLPESDEIPESEASMGEEPMVDEPMDDEPIGDEDSGLSGSGETDSQDDEKKDGDI
jgi:hypothetical protein